MAAELRILRQRVRAVKSIQKTTRAYELIATSRIGRARARVEASRPYAEEITTVLSALTAGSANLNHPLLTPRENPRRAGVLVVTSDKGMCGGYNANLLRKAEELAALLRDEGKSVTLFVSGRKALDYYRFRNRPIEQSWTGYSDLPTYQDAATAGDALVQAFMSGVDSDGTTPATGSTDAGEGLDELHIVYTEFRSMLTQTPVAKRIAPLEVEYSENPAQLPDYEFEPDAETLLGALLPKYVKTRLFAAFLDAAASELAARQRAMKAATDNADDLIRNLTRQANQARQAQITQELSEIVGGADALAAAGSEE
ncbi:MAG TPA: F0F1 ATP synthase subunit gamma [Pseudonocardiaceae bacterium]|jgi:F-type H+-transporting ATPase subunit gamma|nr:F0F1 ATP synthase subunit gamma [Pseudonocardiaceae bacterium]